MTEQDGNSEFSDTDMHDILSTDSIMFWNGLQMGRISLYEHFQEKHKNGLVSDEDIDALVMDRLTEDERKLASLILIETDTECLKELLASPLCSPKVIDYMQECFKGENPEMGKVRGGDSSLLRAARKLQFDKVRLLLEAGANPNVHDFFGNSALHMLLDWRSATEEDVRKIIQILVEYGYDATSVNVEKRKTAFEIRFPPYSSQDVDSFGEGIYEAFDVVSWSEIEEAILMAASSDDEDNQQIFQIVRRLVDLGWGPGADKCAVNGIEKRDNGGCQIRDRLQLVNQVSAPRGEKTLYLYYWDERDGPGYEGWWVADGLGSNGYFYCHLGRNDTPPGAGNWQSSSFLDPEAGFVPVHDGEVEEEGGGGTSAGNNIPIVGYRLDHPTSQWHGRVFKLTKQTYHGKPVYASGQTSSKFEDRCNLLVNKVLLPLLHLAARGRLEDTDEAPCKAFARYLLASRVASECKEKVMAASEQGLAQLEEVLRQGYVEVGPSLDSLKNMDDHDLECKKMNPYHAHGNLDWMELTGDPFLLKSVVALCREGYTLEEICRSFAALGWTNKESYRSRVHALWLIKVAERCDEKLAQVVEARIAQKDDEEQEEQGMKSSQIHPRPSKRYCILEKCFDYHDHIFNGRNYDVGGVTDIARLSLECPTSGDLIHCFSAITEATIDEHGFEVVRIKNGFSLENNFNPRGGYRDVNFNLRVRSPDGEHDTFAEVQLLLKKFVDVKEHMDLLHEVVRGSYF